MFALLRFQAKKRCWYRCVKPGDIVTRLRKKRLAHCSGEEAFSMQKNGHLIHKEKCPTKEQNKENVLATKPSSALSTGVGVFFK